MIKPRVACVVVAVVAAVAGCAGPPVRDEQRVATLQRDVDAIRAIGVTGVQARLAEPDGGQRVASAGVTDLASGRPVPPDAHFRIGSATKSFVATVVLQLVGEGRLGLDDTVHRWLPGLVNSNGNDGRRITVRQLLQHTSGIPDGLPDFGSEADYQRLRFQVRTPEQTVAAALARPADFAPGTAWSYSNTGYVLLGMIIKRVTGQAWHDQVQARVIDPLGLRHTSFPGTAPGLPVPHAHGYQQYRADGPLVDVTELVDADASGGLISTTEDVLTFYRALFGGRLLDEPRLREMRRTVPVNAEINQIWPGARYGLGIFSVPLSCGGRYWMHNGGQQGYLTDDGVTEDGRRAVVVSSTTALAAEEPLPESKGFHQQRAATALVDHALCER